MFFVSTVKLRFWTYEVLHSHRRYAGHKIVGHENDEPEMMTGREIAGQKCSVNKVYSFRRP